MEHRTAHDLLAELRARRVSALELTDAAIADIETRDGAINAVVVRDFERARQAARATDQVRASGQDRPLLGLPMTVKEAFNLAGLPTTWGLPDVAQTPALEDAVIVQRLKAAGAIILGKTNVPVMLGDWQSANPVYGETSNPWDLARSPGGSSGGGAAALAAGFVALEYGSDLANSLRAPAHFCGVYAHKPSYGLTPGRGFAPPGTPVSPIAPSIDMSVLGPMARSAADLALALEVTAGPDEDALAWRLDLPPPRHAGLAEYRVLVLHQHPLIPTAAPIAAALEQLAGQLEAEGCRVARASPLLPDLTQVSETFQKLLMALFTNEISHADWLAADRQRVAIAVQWRALFADWDVVVCPSMPTTALPKGAAGTLQVNGVAMPYDAQPLWGALATLPGLPATAFPVGFDPLGLPIGVQAVGPYLEDRTTIAFAGLVERAFGGFKAPVAP